MRSLSYLNGQSSATVTYTDTRDANVIFDRPDPLDYTFTGTDTTFSVIVGTNIIEIVQPSQTNIRMKVNAGTTQATVSWPTIPVGCTVTQVDTVFTLSGIDSLQDWELVKSPTITLDADFFGTVNYSVEILYDTPTQANKSVRFTVGQYVPAVEMNASASVSCAAGKIVDPELQFEAIATISKLLSIIAIIAELDSEATLEAEFDVVILFEADINSSSNVSSQISLTKETSANLQSTIQMNNPANTINPALTNASVSRSYLSNQTNQNIFGSNTPQISTFIPDTTFTLTLSCANGDFEGASGGFQTGTYSYSGSKSQIESEIASIDFYPDRDFISNTTVVITLNNGNFTASYNAPINFAGTGGTLFATYTFTSTGNQNWTPTREEYTYGNIEYFMIGGGGAGEVEPGGVGTLGGAGGGAGEIKTGTGVPVVNQTYIVNVGAGGYAQYSPSNIYTGRDSIAGIDGNNTTFNGITARGGQGGKASYLDNVATGSTSDWKPSTNGTTNLGGSDGSGTYVGGDVGYASFVLGGYSKEGNFTSTVGGAGGAGSSGNGGDGSLQVVGSTTYNIGGVGGNGTTFEGTTYGYGGVGGSTAQNAIQVEALKPIEYNTPGSGGHGRSGNTGGEAGQDGIVILKITA